MSYGLFSSRLIQSNSEDVFGEEKMCQVLVPDEVNDSLFRSMFKDYLKWHRINHHFHPEFEWDEQKTSLLKGFKYTMFFAGVAFAAVVINPNYTSSKSYYMRKFNLLAFGTVFFAYGEKRYQDQRTMMMLKMYDYMPFEVKRAMQTKDYRHLALFDWENPGRILFDPVTGKSLS